VELVNAMKSAAFVVGFAALAAIAACHSNKGDAKTNAAVKLEQVKPPKGGDWTQVVNPTAAGGFVMGNPDAKVKLIEYGSMTCPHCKRFDDTAVPQLISDYVKSGQVSWEFRNFVRDGVDLTASLVARCNGAKSFYPMTRGLYDDQANWFAKVQGAPQDEVTQIQNLPPNQQFVEMAKLAGFQQWAAARGVPAAKINQCLADQRSVDQLVQMASDATNQFPNFPGTPAFIINGSMVELPAGTTEAQVWPDVQAKIKAALGNGG
jgi:protein-disulfide isomerase